MSLARWNWLNTLRRRMNVGFSKAPRSKFTRRQSLYHRTGPVEALENRLVLTVSVSNPAASEADGTLVFIIQGDGSNTEPINLSDATADGTGADAAVATEDFTTVTGLLTLVPGDTDSHSVSVPINNDSVSEPNDESFVLNVTDDDTATLIACGTGTIQDDDEDAGDGYAGGGTPPSSLTVSVDSVSESEGYPKLTFAISLSAMAPITMTVNYATADGSAIAGSDYVAQSGTLTFSPGDMTHYVDVMLVNDTDVESDETLSLSLTNPSLGLTIGTGTGSGTIQDDDTVTSGSGGGGGGSGSGGGGGSGSGSGAGTPTLDVSDGSGYEDTGFGTGSASFTVTLSSFRTVFTTVNWNVTFPTGQTASSSDFPASGLSGSVTIAPYTTSATFDVDIFDDALVESTETFTVMVSASGTNPGDVLGLGAIYDNEPEISISDWSGTEGSGSVTADFVVTLSFQSNHNISVEYTTSDLTATDGVDFTGVSTPNLLWIYAYQMSATISIPILDDDDVELTPETFQVNLSNAVGAAIADSQGLGTIYDNEPEISITDGSGTEWTSGYGSGSGSGSGSGNVSLQVTLSHASSQTVTVSYASSVDAAQPTANRASMADIGPTNTSGTVTFAPGETTKTILIPIVDDALIEFTEKFKVSLSAATGASISTASGTAKGTIYDNEPTISIADGSGTEGYGSGSGLNEAWFTIFLSNIVSSTVTVDYTAVSLTDDTAFPLSDYEDASGTVTFYPGDIAVSIPVDLVNDDVSESQNFFSVVLTNANGGTISDDTGEITIIDDDGTSGGGGGDGDDGGVVLTPVFEARRKAGGQFPGERFYSIKTDEHFENGSEFEFRVSGAPNYAAPRIEIVDLGTGAILGETAGDEISKTFGVPFGLSRFVRFYDDTNANEQHDAGETAIVSNTFWAQPVTVHNVKARYPTTAGESRPDDIRDIFKGATDIAIKKDHESDFRSAMQFKVKEIHAYVPDVNLRPATGNTPAERNILFANENGSDFTFVETMPGNLPATTEVNILWLPGIPLPTDASIFGNHVIVDLSAFGRATTVLHEFGHTRQLTHLNAIVVSLALDIELAVPNLHVPDAEAPSYVMRALPEPAANRLRKIEADQLD